MDAELEVAPVLLPKLFLVLAFSNLKSERSLLNLDCLLAKLIEQITFESELAERDVSTVWVHARVDKLKLWVAFLNSFFNLLPVNFELFVFVNFCVI